MKKPDWKEPDDYEFTNNLSGAGWAWEFVRRSPDYKDAYLEYLKEAKTIEAQYGPNWKTNPEARKHVPPWDSIDGFDNFLKYGAPEGRLRRRFLWLHELKGEPFELADMYDPEQSLEKGVQFLPHILFPMVIETQDQANDLMQEYDMQEYDVYAPEKNEPDGLINAVKPNIALIAFDFTLSLKKQIGDLSNRLNKIRAKRTLKIPKAPQVNNEAWSQYLRIIDARQKNVKHADIGKLIWPEKMVDGSCTQTSMDRYKQAKNWLEPAQYRKLLLID